jgi:Lipocalin-like domain
MRVVTSGIAVLDPLSVFSSGETNEFASDFCRMQHRGFCIVHDDIRCAWPETIDERATGWCLDSALVGAEKKGDGTKIERYGTSPKGIAFFDAGGRYIITAMRSDRAKYASNALWQGTPDEDKETADGTIAYFGTYSISEADSSIAIHVEGSSFPNWNGTDQKRFVAIAGEQLTLTVRPPGGDVVDVIWKRVK